MFERGDNICIVRGDIRLVVVAEIEREIDSLQWHSVIYPVNHLIQVSK